MKELNVSKLKAVVFDWDNTLAQSGPALVCSVNQVLEKFGLPPWDVMKVKRNNNLSFQDNFPILFGENHQEAYDLYRQIYLKTALKSIKACRFAYPVLHFFKKRDIPICLMTNKDRVLLDFELPILFEPEIFSSVVCGHEAKENKPSSSHLFETLKFVLPREEISPQSVWVIGDSPQDSSCACACGALSIRIGDSLWKEDETPPENCFFFNSFVDFYQSLLLSNP